MMMSKILDEIRDAKAVVNTADPGVQRTRARDALKNILFNYCDDLVNAVEGYAVLEAENKDLKEQIDNLASELDAADEDYNALKQQLRASDEKVVAEGSEL